MSRDALMAGVAAHNVGEYGLARGIWAGETPLVSDPEGALREGLAAFATAVLDGRHGEWEAAKAAADRAETLLPDDAHGSVDIGPVERWLTAFRTDPETVERSPPPRLAGDGRGSDAPASQTEAIASVDGDQPTPDKLPLPAAALVAAAVATGVGDDPEIVTDAVRFAREHDRPERTPYATFVRDYASADASQRPTVFERLSAMVERERWKEDDVSGLF